MRGLIRTDFESANILAETIEDVIGFGKCEVTVGRISEVSVKEDSDHAIALAITGKLFGKAIRNAGPAPVVHMTSFHSSYLTFCSERIDSLSKPDKCVTSASWATRNPLTCPKCKAFYHGDDQD